MLTKPKNTTRRFNARFPQRNIPPKSTHPATFSQSPEEAKGTGRRVNGLLLLMHPTTVHGGTFGQLLLDHRRARDHVRPMLGTDLVGGTDLGAARRRSIDPRNRGTALEQRERTNEGTSVSFSRRKA